MPKAKTIDRLEYTKSRFLHEIHEEEIIAHDRAGTEICPVCGAKLIHEAGCVRCLCGWSRC